MAFRILRLALLGAALLATSCFASDLKEIDGIAAIVNNTVITKSQLKARTQQILANMPKDQQQPNLELFSKQVLNNLIMDEIQLDLAAQYKITISDEELNSSLEKLAKQTGKSSVLDLLQHLQPNGTPEAAKEYYRRYLVIQRLQSALIAGEIKISDKEVTRFLNTNKNTNNDVKYRVGLILLPIESPANSEQIAKTRNKAKRLVSELKQGASFEKYAMQHSKASNAIKGGILDWRTAYELPTLFTSHLNALEVGDVIGPIRNGAGFNIIKLVAKQGEDKVATDVYKFSRIIIKYGKEKLNAKQYLEELASKIKTLEDFASIAKKYSQDLVAENTAGVYDWVKPEDLPQDLYSQIKDLPLGKMSKIFKTSEGWNLVFMQNKQKLKQYNKATFAAAKKALFNREYNDKLEAWYKSLYDKAYVEVKI